MMPFNPFSLKEKNILITGASSGIGRQCAISCSNLDANVILIGRKEEKLKETLSFLKQGSHLISAFDVTHYDEIENTISAAVMRIGPINGFIHSAGIELTLPINVMKSKYYEELFSTNVIAGFEFARILSKKKYCHHKKSSFIFIASIMGSVGVSGKIGYCSSKGALISGVKAMALELSEKKIRVNAISPGIVITNMTKKFFENLPTESVEPIRQMHPLGFGNPDDVANACIFLLSDASVWITGTNLIVDGGYSAH